MERGLAKGEQHGQRHGGRKGARFGCLLILLAAVLVPGCARSTAMDPDETMRVAWFTEDLAHGLPRLAQELVYADGSPALADVAEWAQGTQRDGRQVRPPQPVDQRRERWPLLAAALADGTAAYDAQGLLVAVPGPEADADLARLVAAENRDRAVTATVLQGLGRLPADGPGAARLAASLRDARLHHARSARGTLWTPPSSSTSPTTATPSTSGTAPWEGRRP